jgi:hypothetical protein
LRSCYLCHQHAVVVLRIAQKFNMNYFTIAAVGTV